ncbi:MAG: hypothetical protein LBS19_09870 [Clostridiales bacterium]|nr:hypothetical protein [Clostridiales bacterium]
MEMGAALLSQCRVLVVCGKGISEGMAREIDMAERLHIPIYTLDAFINMPESERRCHQGRIMSVPMPNDAKARTGFPVPAGKPSVLERIAGVWRLQNRERRETPASVKSKPHGSER